MSATHVLMEEHQTILRVLACMETLAMNRDLPEANVETFRRIVDFLRTYADRLHHGKEEALLFPAMEARGMSAHMGPTAAMRVEHDQGRALVRRMAAACDRDEAEVTAAFRGPALDFVNLLRAHIGKEDHILFHMADQMLDDAAVTDLETAYVEAEARDFDPDVHTRYEAWALELAHSLGIHDEVFRAMPACHG